MEENQHQENWEECERGMKEVLYKNPIKTGYYICVMVNGDIKNDCYWNGIEWLDMSNELGENPRLKGIVKNWIEIPNNP